MMQVRYNLNWLGWLTAVQHGYVRLQREIGYGWLFWNLHVLAWMFVGFWAMSAMDVLQGRNRKLTEFGLLAAPALAAGVYLLAKVLRYRMQKSVVRKRVPTQEFTVRVEDDGLHFEGRESQHLPWESIANVVRLRAHLAIETVTFSVATIPLDAFPTPSDLDEFVSAIRARAPRLRGDG